MPPTERYRYWPSYCEENVWHLCGESEIAGRDAQVAFISNTERQVALWGQRSAESPWLPVVWDYHVVLLVRGDDRAWQIWDLDTVFGFPLLAEVYLERTFPEHGRLPEIYAARFRVVAAAVYRRELRSDRRHMRRRDGTWLSPPPPWPAIGSGSNLMRFADVVRPGPGHLCDLDGLRRRLETSLVDVAEAPVSPRS